MDTGAIAGRSAPLPPSVPLRQAAAALEVSFLSEMLQAAGLGQGPKAFGGGAGEDHFASFLVEEQARALVAAGGIGLSEAIFDALVARDGGVGHV